MMRDFSLLLKHVKLSFAQYLLNTALKTFKLNILIQEK